MPGELEATPESDTAPDRSPEGHSAVRPAVHRPGAVGSASTRVSHVCAIIYERTASSRVLLTLEGIFGSLLSCMWDLKVLYLQKSSLTLW